MALLSKATLLLLGPLWILLWVVHRWQQAAWTGRVGQEWQQLAALLLMAGFVLNLGYGFSGTGTTLKEFEFVSHALAGEIRPNQLSSNRFRSTGLGELPSPVPREFLLGLDMQKRDFENGRWTFLAGRWKWGGIPYFYLAAIAIKSPLGYGVLLLIVIAVIWRGGARSRQSGAVLGWTIISIIGFVSLEQGFTAFVRYVLPALPFAIVLLSGVGLWVESGTRLARYAVGVTLVWIVSSSVWCLPFSLSYFNELVGGPANGHEYLFDSNVDWGQDLYFVKDWVKRHPAARPITLSWHDIFDPELAGLNLPRTPSPPQEQGEPVRPRPDSSFEGWHIVCVNNLHSADQRFAYLRELQPVDRIGDSVMVYHLDKQQAERAKARISPPLMPPKQR